MNVTLKTYPPSPAPVGQEVSVRAWTPFRGLPQPAVRWLVVLAVVVVGAFAWQHAEQLAALLDLAALLELAIFVAAGGRLVRA